MQELPVGDLGKALQKTMIGKKPDAYFSKESTHFAS